MKYRFKLIFDLEGGYLGYVNVYQEAPDYALTHKGEIRIDYVDCKSVMTHHTLNESHIHSEYQEDIINSLVKRALDIADIIYPMLDDYGSRFLSTDTFEYTRED